MCASPCLCTHLPCCSVCFPLSPKLSFTSSSGQKLALCQDAVPGCGATQLPLLHSLCDACLDVFIYLFSCFFWVLCLLVFEAGSYSTSAWPGIHSSPQIALKSLLILLPQSPARAGITGRTSLPATTSVVSSWPETCPCRHYKRCLMDSLWINADDHCNIRHADTGSIFSFHKWGWVTWFHHLLAYRNTRILTHGLLTLKTVTCVIYSFYSLLLNLVLSKYFRMEVIN